MSGILVVAEVRDGAIRPVTSELMTAACELSEQGMGPVRALVVAGDPAAVAATASLAGVEEALLASSPHEHFEAHVSAAALEAAIAQLSPSAVLASHTIDSLGFAPAVAARGGHGFASDVTSLRLEGEALRAGRELYGGRLQSEVELRPGRSSIVLLRAGAWEPASGADDGANGVSGGANGVSGNANGVSGTGCGITALDVDLSHAPRTEHVSFTSPPSGDVDIERADFLLSIGRGVEEQESIPTFERLAERLGATLSASRPLVDAGWLPSSRQVGQSGRTVTPKVYLALGISGAVQHLAGMSRSGTIIAVNSDPAAPIFGAAHYGAVADLNEVAEAIEQQIG